MMDTLRLAIFRKNAFDIHGLNASLAFQIYSMMVKRKAKRKKRFVLIERMPIFLIGFNITFYITQLTASGIYTSVDIGHNNILFPQSLEDLPSFFTVATLNRLITIHDTFWHCCKKSKHPDAIKSRYKPTLLTLDDPMIDPSQDSKHSCQLRCGH